jgi:hypothetical protein
MLLPSLADAVALDVVVLVICAAGLLRFARLSVSIPQQFISRFTLQL